MELLSKSNANIDEVLQRVDSLNKTTRTILSHSEGSMKSLQSVSSSVSRMSSHGDLGRIMEEPPPPYGSISRASSSYSVKNSSRPSMAYSARRALSSGSQTSPSIFGWSSVEESVRPGHKLERKRSGYVVPQMFCTAEYSF